jgi:hypothetical protein
MKRRLTLTTLVVCAASALLAVVLMGSAPTRVVAVADVHGAFSELVTMLQRTALIDGNRQWIGGTTTFVQTGDVMDRGAKTRDCLDLLMELEPQAEKAGGKLIPLLGNHEVMNLMNDLRYVTPAIYASFATEQSARVQDEEFKNYQKFVSVHREHNHTAVFPNDEEGRKKWMEARPPGYYEYVDALGPEGKYGRWIRKHDAIAEVADGLFVHGGLSPSLNLRSVAELNGQIRSEIAGFDSIWTTLADRKVIWRYMTLVEAIQSVSEEAKWILARGIIDDPIAVEAMQKLLGYQSWLCVSSEGPMWYRGLAQEPEEKLMGSVVEILARFKAKFLVEGHTVRSKSDIIPRFENRVFLLDTGMNTEAYQGRPSALEIKDGKFTAYYADGEPKSLGQPGGNKAAEPAGAEPKSKEEMR